MTALANPSAWYIGSDKYASVAPWAASTVYPAGSLVRQLTTPAVGSERVFVSVTSSATSGSSEPTWVLTKGAETLDNSAIAWYECTGQPPVNGDIISSPSWAASRATTKGQIIYDSVSGALQIVISISGTTKSGSPPTFSATAGTSTTDNTTTWYSLGAASNFTPWAAPHARILNADAASWSPNAGNMMYISSGHAETQSTANTLAGGQGTAAAPNKYLSVGTSVAPPTAVSAGASVTITGTSTVLTVQAYGYWYGISFIAGSNTSTGAYIEINPNFMWMESCTFQLYNTSGSSVIYLTSNSAIALQHLNNCTFVFGAIGQSVDLYNSCKVIAQGCTFAATGTVPLTLFTMPGSTYRTDVVVRDSDMSAVTGTLLNVGSASGKVSLQNSKLGSGVAMTSGTLTDGSSIEFQLLNCDSGSKNYRFYVSNYSGTIQQETTTVRTGGASDGTTPISWNFSTSANAGFTQPLYTEILPIIEWQNTTGSSHTATVEIAGANTLTNAQIWMELEYPGNASYPIGSIATSRAASVLATPSNVPSSSASWGGSPAVTQHLQVTFTPQMVGPIKARIYVADPSITVYVDPLITIT